MSVERIDEQAEGQVDPAARVGDWLLLTVEEAASRLQVGRTTMYELVRRGEVESVPIGRLRRIPTVCLDEYVVRLRTRGDSGPRPAA